MRVRRKHHAGNGTYNTLQRTRARSKPRPISVAILRHHKGSDVTSSDDERPSARRNTESALPCSSTRRSTLIPRNSKVFGTYQSHQRCYTCAAKFTSCSLAFQCRCGKTLCTRHRPADMHTCARIRKSQDIGD
ncbi:hypothetical protein AB6A40_005534 [Gnathostoma spinigerum]|uniref:AN1-type domain-containing protein n=1 Tax=Gnathostoma spinigerum TaxID=75299 RepID=A0ABD6ERD7_9BILA